MTTSVSEDRASATPDPEPSAARQVEFVHSFLQAITAKGGGSARKGTDPARTDRFARTLDDYGFDYTLLGYSSDGADPFSIASRVLARTERLKTIVALRPNICHPTVAAQALTTLDHLSGGRTIVHVISGGSDAEQRRQGDYLPKSERYARSAEYIEILRRVWREDAPFSHHGDHYRFEEFGPGSQPLSGGPLPISIGGASDEAFDVGSRLADIFTLWGEPLKETAEQIHRVRTLAAAAGRDPSEIRFWVTFRPVVAETDELAWRKAERLVERSAGRLWPTNDTKREPRTNVGSVRLQEIAEQSEHHDTALWMPRSIAGAGGASSLLVGSPDTIATAIEAYVRLGADIVSLPSAGDLDGAVDTGRYIIPLVRERLAAAAAAGR
ncbi:LLM class flavin-dependent oxidoreductase [Nocardioides sp.]|uniref:LLM class flavin-dependent oxidoreductase n=1 Tax=Nocardioides sp. TaxID=35761 RepID=UPI0027181399|nr:LLM class flavin-dependent oxidoreductase [Nocardioides sp.]MDO9458160.1 LLM class flavin-dependent oxidoreductase [Nocardioides sp.]